MAVSRQAEVERALQRELLGLQLELVSLREPVPRSAEGTQKAESSWVPQRRA